MLKNDRWLTVGLALVVLATGAVSWAVYLRTPLAVRAESLAEIPIRIDRWIGGDLEVESGVAEMLDADFNVQRIYEHPVGGGLMWLYVGYYGTQRGGRPEHTPWTCYPSNGWDIVRKDVIELDPNSDFRANEILVEREGEQRLVHFWYQSYRRHGMLGDFDQAIERLRNRVFDGRADGSLVRLSTPIDGPDSEDSARVLLKQFAQSLAPLLRDHWPEELVAPPS
ncbi:MAG: EpsI family protein [bacterium]|nr:EpsI family protein [bacterium]